MSTLFPRARCFDLRVSDCRCPADADVLPSQRSTVLRGVPVRSKTDVSPPPPSPRPSRSIYNPRGWRDESFATSQLTYSLSPVILRTVRTVHCTGLGGKGEKHTELWDHTGPPNMLNVKGNGFCFKKEKKKLTDSCAIKIEPCSGSPGTTNCPLC